MYITNFYIISKLSNYKLYIYNTEILYKNKLLKEFCYKSFKNCKIISLESFLYILYYTMM